jgi:hypothetical protein
MTRTVIGSTATMSSTVVAMRLNPVIGVPFGPDVMPRLYEKTTSLAWSGSPVWKRTFGRSWNVQVFPPSSDFQLVANPGAILSFSIRTRLSKQASMTSPDSPTSSKPGSKVGGKSEVAIVMRSAIRAGCGAVPAPGCAGVPGAGWGAQAASRLLASGAPPASASRRSASRRDNGAGSSVIAALLLWP